MRSKDLSRHIEVLKHQAESRLEEARRHTDDARTLVSEAQESYRAARQRGFLTRLLFFSSPDQDRAERVLDREDRRFFRSLAAQQRAQSEFDRLRAGEKGEEKLVELLGNELDDDWVLFNGYRNDQGEIDGTLVGPGGIWCIEVKFYNARLRIDGPRWWYERVDDRGIVREIADATDAGGRVWGRQASDVAGSLERWLDQNGVRLTPRTVVFLAHPRGVVAEVNDPGVSLVIDDHHELLSDIRRSAQDVDPETRRTVEDLIERDHAHHNPGHGD
jgi:hypothetical protein